MYEQMKKVTIWTDTSVQLSEIYLVPGKSGKLEPRVWRGDRVYKPSFDGNGAHDWKEFFTIRVLSSSQMDWLIGQELDYTKLNQFQRIVTKVLGRKITWVSLPGMHYGKTKEVQYG